MKKEEKDEIEICGCSCCCSRGPFFSLPYAAKAQVKDKIRIGFSISLTGNYASGL